MTPDGPACLAQDLGCYGNSSMMLFLDYNTRLETVPSNLIATPCGFRPETFFEAPAEARQKVPVTF